jgi:RNA polymerase sigma-70 factor (ECF subfamily)
VNRSYPLIRTKRPIPDSWLEDLWREHSGPLFSFLAYRTGDRELAQDLLADAFERAARARRRFDPRRGTQKAWLYAIALNLARDHARREATAERALGRRVTEPDADAPDRAAVVALHGAELRGALGPALARLGPEEREAIALRYGADLTVPEIARVTGERLTTVEGRVYRALRKLREELTPEPATRAPAARR